jgi:hypothetical protein
MNAEMVSELFDDPSQRAGSRRKCRINMNVMEE